MTCGAPRFAAHLPGPPRSARLPRRPAGPRRSQPPRRNALGTMWIPLLAFLAAALVSLQRCPRGPGPGPKLAAAAAARVLAAAPSWCQRAENKCATSNAGTCTKCLAVGPECGWCTQEDFMGEATQSGRCDTVFNLIKKGCQSDFIENPRNSITVPSDHEANAQVTPGKVSIHLRPVAENKGRNFKVEEQGSASPHLLYPLD